MKRYVKSATNRTLSGEVVIERLIDKCYWSPDATYDIDEDAEYTLDELTDVFISNGVSSGEFESAREAVAWAEECAKAVFENREPNY